MTEELKCTYQVRIDDGKDWQGNPRFHHQACGEPAAEFEIGGTLTRAKAVLCSHHKQLVDRQNFTSKQGYAFGKIDRDAKKEGYRQERLPGTGIVQKDAS